MGSVHVWTEDEGPDRFDERYRYCIYCKADCWLEEENREHADDCPFVTGVWPVTEDELRPNGMVCIDCEQPFNLGDSYILRDCDTGAIAKRPVTGSISESICVGCGALAGLIQDPPKDQSHD